MAIEENKLSEEEIQQQRTELGQKEHNILGDIISNDAYKGLGDEEAIQQRRTEEPEVKKEKKEVVREEEPVDETEPEEQPEAVEEAPEQAEETNEEAEPEAEETDEDLIPQSKVQKRFDQLTSKIKALEQQLAEKEVEKPKETSNKDEQLEKLREIYFSKGREAVEAIQDDVLLKLPNTDDENQRVEMVKLNRKISNFLAVADRDFEREQIERFEKVARTTASDPDIRDLKEAGKEIFSIAKEIFTSSDVLKKSLNGQAEAWKLAVKHYKTLQSSSSTKASEVKLKREVNNLKKKTSLDTSSIKGIAKKPDDRQLREKAKSGNTNDKMAYFRDSIVKDIDSLVKFN